MVTNELTKSWWCWKSDCLGHSVALVERLWLLAKRKIQVSFCFNYETHSSIKSNEIKLYHINSWTGHELVEAGEWVQFLLSLLLIGKLSLIRGKKQRQQKTTTTTTMTAKFRFVRLVQFELGTSSFAFPVSLCFYSIRFVKFHFIHLRWTLRFVISLVRCSRASCCRREFMASTLIFPLDARVCARRDMQIRRPNKTEQNKFEF